MATQTQARDPNRSANGNIIHVKSEAASVIGIGLAKSYRRNRNSRSKTKNLRCFPACCEGGHVNNGFCGQAITFTIRLPAERIYACATFCALDASVTLPQTLPEERGKTNPLGYWIPVQVEPLGSNLFELTVNPELLGWHYSWRATKGTRNTRHTLRTFLFEQEGDALTLLRHVDTQSFLLYSGVEKGGDAPDNEVLEGGSADKRKGLDGETSDVWVMSRRRVNDTEEVLGMGVVRPENRQNLDDIPIRKLLEKATIVGVCSDSGRCAERGKALGFEEEFGEGDVTESDESILDFLGDPNDFMKEFDLVQFDSDSFDSVEHDFELSVDAQRQIIQSLTSDQLASDLVDFYTECSTGPVGSAFCEYIDVVEDTAEFNMLVPFAKILFHKYQKIIMRRIEADLYEGGFLTKCKIQSDVRGSAASTTAAFKAVEDGAEFMYDPEDQKTVKRFLQRIQYMKRRKNLAIMARMERKLNPGSPYAALNRSWEFVAGEGNFFEDILEKELNVMSSTLAAVLSKVTERLTYFVTPEKICMQGKRVLGTDGVQEMITDGRRHEFDDSPILFQYLESPSMSYVAKQKMDSDGNWMSRAAMCFYHPGLESYVYTMTETRFQASSPDHMLLKRRMMRTKELLDSDTILLYCSSDACPYILGKSFYEYSLRARV